MFLLRLLGAVLLATPLIVATRAAARPSDDAGEPKSEWVFSLLPSSLSKNPRLSLTVVTEFTPAGRELEPPTREDPVWCVLFNAGRLQRGSAAPAGESAPMPDVLEKQLRAALAGNGYRVTETPAEHPPRLAVIMHWGSYTTVTETDDLESVPEVVRRRELVERAALVGGEKFAEDLATAIVQRDKVSDATHKPREITLADGTAVTPISRIGGDVGSMTGFDLMDPLYLFENRDTKTTRLMAQSRASFYFVIASAFDYASLATPQRRLLWRTKMTVASDGVTMVQTLPVLIANSAPYVGREMTEPVTATRRVKDGKVRIDPAEVLGYEDEPEAAPTSPDKRAESTNKKP